MKAITLPPSKSVLNRLQVIRALAGEPLLPPLEGEGEDARLLRVALLSEGRDFDAGDAGTVARFLTAYLASREAGEWHLTASPRMCERPMEQLIGALRKLGAKIICTGREGYLPFTIVSGEMKGGVVMFDRIDSSQFVSALMMVAPYLKGGVHMEISKVFSKHYIEMTAGLMRRCGIGVGYEYNPFGIPEAVLEVEEGKYSIPDRSLMEPDWSGASYFFEAMAVMGSTEPWLLKGLSPYTLQGDALQMELWEHLGVESQFVPEGIMISRPQKPEITEPLFYDFRNAPDLVPAFVVGCCLCDCPFRFTGLSSLAHKESNRAQMLVDGLHALGYEVEYLGGDTLKWFHQRCDTIKKPVIKTADDHRMAMAFAVAQFLRDDIKIDRPEVVVKSFPEFWNCLKNLIN